VSAIDWARLRSITARDIVSALQPARSPSPSLGAIPDRQTCLRRLHMLLYGRMDRAGGSWMGTTTVRVPLSDETRERLKEVAARSHRTEQETAASIIEAVLAVDEVEVEIIRQRLAQADAGGPFGRHEDVLAWLRALSEGEEMPPPKATITD
jgi:predicted transcriptional regulator